MTIKTSLHLKASQSVMLYTLAEQFNLSLSFICNSLARKVFRSHSFSPKFLGRVQYQPRLIHDTDSWDYVPVSFEGDVYEKCLDMRKVYKTSVSLVFAFAIKKYLDELIQEFEGKKESDNYTSNYFLFYTASGPFRQIIQLWDMIEPEKLKKLQRLHSKT